jgi:protein-disulfide isomerase
MNQTAKHIAYWGSFFIIILLIIWGLIAASKKATGVASDAPLDLLAPVVSTDWILGSSSAPAVLVEYSDFECPSCAAYYPVINKLIKEEGSKLQAIYRHFPLPQHGNAIIAAQAAEAAGLQGKFWEMHDLLFEKQNEWEVISDPRQKFSEYAQSLSLNSTTFLKDIDLDVVRNKVSNGYKESVKNSLSYTPTFFLNGKRIQNPQDYDAFKKIIDDTTQIHP